LWLSGLPGLAFLNHDILIDYVETDQYVAFRGVLDIIRRGVHLSPVEAIINGCSLTELYCTYLKNTRRNLDV
jgi:hypothetical protein